MSILRSLINLAYPPACLLCQASLPAAASEAVLCDGCAKALPRTGRPSCRRCGATIPGAFDAVTDCRLCRARPAAFERAGAPWRYAGLARRAVHQLKYRRRWRVGNLAAAEMARLASRTMPVEEIDLVAPVPSHWLRRRLRGFTAAELLGRRVAGSLRRPYAPGALRRSRWTPSQTRLRGHTRLRNVRGAFRASPERVRDRTVLLVDDVLTTGATAHACAQALRRAGASRVFVLTAARSSRRPPA